MTDKIWSSGVVAKKLREAGYVPLPRWWVKPEDVEVVRRLTAHRVPEIYKLRDEARLEQELREYSGSRHGWGEGGR